MIENTRTHSLFEEPQDGPFCEEQEVKAIRPELADPVLTYVPEAIPAPVPEVVAPPAKRDCGCNKAGIIQPMPEQTAPATLAPEAPLCPDSPYVYVENEFGELAAMWMTNAPILEDEADEAATSAPASNPEEPAAAVVEAEEASLPENEVMEAPLAEDSAPFVAAPIVPEETVAPVVVESVLPEPQPVPETFISPFRAVEYPEIKPQFRAEPKPEAAPAAKPDPQFGTGFAKTREVWRMS